MMEGEGTGSVKLVYRDKYAKEAFFPNHRPPPIDVALHIRKLDAFLVVIVLALLFSLLIHYMWPPKEDPDRNYTMWTYCARYEYKHPPKDQKQVLIFRNVPYAVPPIQFPDKPTLNLIKVTARDIEDVGIRKYGLFRFASPVPLNSLERCYLALSRRNCRFEYGTFTCNPNVESHTCLQEGIFEKEPKLSGQEDCLSLDIMTPVVNMMDTNKKEKFPVVAYISGVQNIIDKINESFYLANETFVTKHKVIFVKIRYRLGVLSQKLELSNGSRVVNLGVQDVMTALGWIQTNIHYFSGDPKQVTLLAHGTGATIALALLQNNAPTAMTFHRLWLSSPSVYIDDAAKKDIRVNSMKKYMKAARDHVQRHFCQANVLPHELQVCDPKNIDSEELLPRLYSAPTLWQIRNDYHYSDNLKRFADINRDDLPFSHFGLDGATFWVDPLTPGMDRFSVPTVLTVMQHEFDGVLEIDDIKGESAVHVEYENKRLADLKSWSVEELIEKLNLRDYTIRSTFVASVRRVVCPTYFLFKRLLSSTSNDPHHMIVHSVRPSMAVRGAYYYPHSLKTMAFHGMDMLTLLGHMHNFVPEPTNEESEYEENLQKIFFNFVKGEDTELTHGIVQHFTPNAKFQEMNTDWFTHYCAMDVDQQLADFFLPSAMRN